MSIQGRTAHWATVAASGCTALALPVSIVFGRAALAVSLGLAFIALVVAFGGGMRWRLQGNGVRIAFGAMLVVSIAWLPTIVHSLSVSASLLALARTLGVIFAGIALATFLIDKADFSRIRLFILAMLAAELFAVAALYLWPWLMAFRTAGPPAPHMMLKASASGIACALPLLLCGGWYLRGRWWWAVAACITLGVMIMIATGSKSSLAGGLAATGLSAYLVLSRSWRPWLTVLGLACLVSLGVLAFVLVIRPLTPDLAMGGYSLFVPTWLIDAHRQIIWQFTLDRFLERPWLGWGLNAITLVPGASDNIPELYQAEFIPSHPHNWMVEALSESGIAGFIPLLLVIVGIVWAAARSYRADSQAWRLGWVALWLSYWSAGAFNFSMWNASWQATGLALSVLMLSLPRKKGAGSK